jgi:predicted P-loop ATPase
VAKFHPIKDYLEEATWDGKKRAENLFIDYLGAANTHYTRQITRKMLLAAVSRIYRPGCKFDQMLVLVGPQGAHKSSILAKLGARWFSDSLRTFDNKEAGEHLQNAWIFEIGELSALNKTEVEEVKAFLSKTEDRYRVAYDRQVSDFPRKCIFFGTTNTKEFLRDPTGNRRFWPLDVDPTKAKLSHWDHLGEYEVQQVWAEVYQWFKSNESLLLDDKAHLAAEREQNAHMMIDPKEGMLRSWLDEEEMEEDLPTGRARTQVCAVQVWTDCFNKRRGDISAWESKNIADLLRRVGWKEKPGRITVNGYGRQNVFEKADE